MAGRFWRAAAGIVSGQHCMSSKNALCIDVSVEKVFVAVLVSFWFRRLRFRKFRFRLVSQKFSCMVSFWFRRFCFRSVSIGWVSIGWNIITVVG